MKSRTLFDPYRLDWAAFDDGTFAHHAALVRLRRTHAALRQGAVSFEADVPAGVVGHWRHGPDGRVGVFVNLSGDPAALPARLAGLPGLYQGPGDVVALPPLGWRVVNDTTA